MFYLLSSFFFFLFLMFATSVFITAAEAAVRLQNNKLTPSK